MSSEAISAVLSNCGTVRISNLPPDTTEEELTELCCEYGEVRRTVVPQGDEDTSVTAFVTYSRKDAARCISQMNGFMLTQVEFGMYPFGGIGYSTY